MAKLAPLAGLCACAFALAANAQADPRPVFNRCDSLAALRIGPERGSAASPLPHELLAQLDKARADCEQAVAEQPRERRLLGKLARVRALAGERKAALEAARAGAELGSPTAQVILGVLLAEGEVVPRDYEGAREQFRRAAREGQPHAHFNLGALLANGWGVEADEANAAAAFRRAALGGEVLAMQLMGQRYDAAQAESWLKKAAEAMHPEPGRSPLRIAALGRAAPDEAALLAWYEGKARGAEPWAQAYLGALYESGQWVRPDPAAAARWYRSAAEAGHVAAQWRLAGLYREGRGVPRDLAEAKRWSERWQVQRCEALERAEPGLNRCDRLADESVDSFCMRQFAQGAIAACTQARKDFPSIARFGAQRARALAHTGRFAEARRDALAAAEAGSGAAMVLMGVMSQRGLGAPPDEAGAQAWYRKAAATGDPRGAALAGLPIVTRVPVPAVPAEPRDARSQHNLAARLEREKKYDEAMLWYQRAADQGDGASAMNLAQMYEKGIGVKPDAAEAMRRYRRLADQGDGESRYRLARLAAEAGNVAEALQLYAKGVREDDYRAMLDLGEIYEHGRGVRRDVPRAAGLYERAAERSGWARFKVGTLHLAGDGMPKDYAKALRWLRRASGDGHAGARNNLGLMHEQGLGVPVDYLAARDLYLAALGGANPQAKGNLERFYLEGRGAPSGAAAAGWYRKGAEAGIATAQHRLGRIYANGEGTKRDEREAVKWLAAAARQGHPEARKEAAALYFALGDMVEAAAYGHAGAQKALAAQLATAGPKEQAELLQRMYGGPPAFPPPPVWPQGIALEAGEDTQRTLQVRSAGTGARHAAAQNAALANIYDIIRWFPETDGKPR